jgi:hypothetical protein
LSYADGIENTTQQAVRQTLDLATTDPTQVDEAYLTKLFTDLQQHRMGVLTHVIDIQKAALEKINQELNTSTFILHVETSGLATDQAEQREHLPAPIAHATRSNKRPPNRMVYSLRTRVRTEYTVLLVFLLVFYFKFSAGISILNILQVNERAAGA